MEGTAAGILGSVVLATMGAAMGLIDMRGAGVCVLAALGATTCESLIGALAQDRVPWLTNELVNGIMTVIGASLGAGLGGLGVIT